MENKENLQGVPETNQNGTNINININQPVLHATTKKINGILYFIMTWFFGWLGVHRFM